MANTNMHRAKRNKNDEFYTQLSDIERELVHYREQLKGKSVYMNCDNPKESNFWKYFKLNFEHLGLKKITSTHYHPDNQVYKLEYDGKDLVKTDLEQNGDFRSPEAIEVLKSSDVVVTNPPFSLFREFTAQMMEYDKDFIVIGNTNAITYKEVFPLLKDNRMWLGQSYGTMEFIIPKDSPEKSGQRTDEDGIRYQKFGNITWYTNLEIPRLSERLILFKEYDSDEYPTYNNYDVINVDKVSNIPLNYSGVMGVPITYLNKHNPDQFEILGLANSARWLGYECITIIGERKVYNRILIQRKDKDNED